MSEEVLTIVLSKLKVLKEEAYYTPTVSEGYYLYRDGIVGIINSLAPVTITKAEHDELLEIKARMESLEH